MDTVGSKISLSLEPYVLHNLFLRFWNPQDEQKTSLNKKVDLTKLFFSRSSTYAAWPAKCHPQQTALIKNGGAVYQGVGASEIYSAAQCQSLN